MTDSTFAQRQPDGSVAVVLYTQPHCSACRSVEQYLVGRGVPFEVRDVFENASALEEIEARGYLTTPVTRIGDEWIPGFRRSAFDAALARMDT